LTTCTAVSFAFTGDRRAHEQEVVEITPWTLDQLMALIREVGAFRRERRKTGDAAH
jgi:hypothetical protein